ncbi:uncharacterized protein LOC110461162 [Mizuhopecten yessoensis]|uniref:uncharacterized protein LOC110461162 n=1 Tax=Mizuhopecten yessoensis TaxID=6573 RepID=UPI000B458F9E|nr:uncharacterized protein LOC110461162 [Mizuhopecten yessoensis]
MAEEQEHLDTARIRTLSIKADENYLVACERYIKKIDSICCKLKNTVAELSTVETSDKTQVQEWRVKLCAIRKEYEILSYEYLGFLQRTHTENSLCKYNEHKNNMTSMNETVKDAMDSIRDIPTSKDPVSEEIDNSVKVRKSSVSSHSVTTSGKSKTSIATQKRAKAEAARASLEIAKKEVLLRKQMAALEEEGRLAEAKKDRIKAEYNADLTLLAEEKEVAAADAEASYLESESGSVRSRGSFILHHSIPTRISNTEEMTRQYVASLPDWNVQDKGNLHVSQTEGEIYTNIQNITHTVPMDTQMQQSVVLAPKAPPFIPHRASKDCSVKPDTEALTSFLLKKELLLQRLYKFDDEPPSFVVWKASFNSVTQELKVNSFVQLDLLVKYLGKESSLYAQSLRTSNARNPERAVRLIWERLEERYGCPEMIEFALKSKLEKFPVLSNEDNKKLYELSDVLDEVLSAKEDPRFAVQFAVFDSSRGVNSIVAKLPYNIQQKWVTHASRYKKQRNIPYPSFSVFVEFIHDVCKIRNDPAFNWKPYLYLIRRRRNLLPSVKMTKCLWSTGKLVFRRNRQRPTKTTG